MHLPEVKSGYKLFLQQLPSLFIPSLHFSFSFIPPRRRHEMQDV